MQISSVMPMLCLVHWSSVIIMTCAIFAERWLKRCHAILMHGDDFRITDLCNRNPQVRASSAELWWFLCSWSTGSVEQTVEFETPWRSCHCATNRYSLWHSHYNDVIMSAMAPQITSLTIVYSTVYSGTGQRKYQSSASLASVRGIHRWPVNSLHKGPVTRKMLPFDDVIMVE